MYIYSYTDSPKTFCDLAVTTKNFNQNKLALQWNIDEKHVKICVENIVEFC
jgi:hypothetical protein